MEMKRLIPSLGWLSILLLGAVLVACPRQPVQPPDANPPAAPTNLLADSGDMRCTIRWDASSGASAYFVYQSTSSPVDASGDGNEVVATSYQATDLANGTTYYYVVRASNAAGRSAPSEAVSCRPIPEPVAITVSGNVSFDTGGPVEGATVLGSTVTTFTPSGLHITQMNQDVTDASGNFTLELGPEVLPARVLVEITFQSEALPVVRTAKWGDSGGATFDFGAILIPNPAGAEIPLSNGSGRNNDGSIQVQGLPAEVEALYGRSYDPDETPEVFPGEFAENGVISLNSANFLWMEALDANGDPVDNFADAVKIRTRVPRSQWGDLEDVIAGTDRIEIPMYSFNETTQLWVEMDANGWLENEGGAVLPENVQPLILDGSFPGEIYAAFRTSHLSWMNVDYPYIGPWTLRHLDRDKRNTDCLYRAARLAETIFRSNWANQGFRDVNKSDAPPLNEEIPDEKGPEIKAEDLGETTFGQTRSGDFKENLYLNSRLWEQCDAKKKETIFLMAVTLLHETGHWKHDVHLNDGVYSDEGHLDAKEAGLQVERNLFGDKRSIWTKDGKLPLSDGLRVDSDSGSQDITDGQLDQLNDPQWWKDNDANFSEDFWNSFWAGTGGSSLGTMQVSPPLEVTLSLAQTIFDLGAPVPVNIAYENVSASAIRVLTLDLLQSYPLYFEVRDADGNLVPFIGAKLKLGFGDDDFMTLAPGETRQFSVDLTRGPDGAPYFNLNRSGAYTVRAFYSDNFGLPEAVSNTVSFEVGAGGSVSGTVSNASNGNPIEGATVRAFQGSNVLGTATSDTSGFYSIPELPGGTYDLRATALGFLGSTAGGAVVVSGQDTSVNFELSSGGDVVVFNDINIFDTSAMTDENNVLLVRQLVSFSTAGGPRDEGTVVWFDRGRNSTCGPVGNNECNDSNLATMRATIEDEGFSIEEINSTSGSIISIPLGVKSIFLWNPLVEYAVEEINTFKQFAAEGGRLVFIGEHEVFYGQGIPIQNAFLVNMGALMTNVGDAVDCGYTVLPGASLRPHPITDGLTQLTIACASVIELGPNDLPLFFGTSNEKVLAGIAAIDTTPIATSIFSASDFEAKPASNKGLKPDSATGY